MKVVQPFRNPTDFNCFLEGVKRTAELFGFKVDSTAWGGGLPIDLTLYKPEEKPEPVVTVEIPAPEEEKPAKKKTRKRKTYGEPNSRAQ
jgi:hypothetical protein